MLAVRLYILATIAHSATTSCLYIFGLAFTAIHRRLPVLVNARRIEPVGTLRTWWDEKADHALVHALACCHAPRA